MKRASGLLVLLLGFAAQAAQVYTWTDEKGRTHFSDKPVPSAKKIEVNPPGAAAEAAAQETDAAKRAQACQAKREQVETYQKASKVIERDSLGRETEFSEAERQQLIARVQQQADEACNPKPVTATSPAQKVEPAARADSLPQK